jgi:hypothetical protein
VNEAEMAAMALEVEAGPSKTIGALVLLHTPDCDRRHLVLVRLKATVIEIGSSIAAKHSVQTATFE